MTPFKNNEDIFFFRKTNKTKLKTLSAINYSALKP